MAGAGKVKRVAPDGGWGWMIVLAMAVNNIITIPILQNFGLLFRDYFQLKAVNISITEASIITVTNSAFGYIVGLLNGPILRNLGFRKVAVTGSLMMFIGLFATAFTNSFLIFFVFYGLINSLGIGWSMASYHLALSTYFVSRRGMAMGIAMTITGLGPVVVPFLISYLMDYFGTKGTALLLSGIVLHTVAGGLLLQPVKRHCKQIMFTDDSHYEKVLDEKRAMLDTTIATEASGSKQNGEKELEMVDLVASLEKNLVGENSDNVESKKGRVTWYQQIVQKFDLDLLKDPAFLSMCVGMSIALASDMNFSLMLPFILGDYGFDNHTTAVIQSIVGTADILSRFFTPFLIRKVKISARIAYLLSLIGLIVSRFWLTLSSQLLSVQLVVALFGFSKGVRSVFMPLVIPNYVPLDKLASAQGHQNFMHGLCLMPLGPLIGYLRRKTGNYTACIHVMNSLTSLTILLWTMEFIYMKRQKKNTFADNVDLER